MELNIVINESKTALKELGIWKYCTKEERVAFKHSQTGAEVARLSRTYRDKYFDRMYADYEEEESNKDIICITPNTISVHGSTMIIKNDAKIVNMNISRRTKNALVRNHIDTLREFASFVSTNGWDRLRSFGQLAAEEMMAVLLNINYGNMTAEQKQTVLQVVADLKDTRKAMKYAS